MGLITVPDRTATRAEREKDIYLGITLEKKLEQFINGLNLVEDNSGELDYETLGEESGSTVKVLVAPDPNEAVGEATNQEEAENRNAETPHVSPNSIMPGSEIPPV